MDQNIIERKNLFPDVYYVVKGVFNVLMLCI